MKVALISPYSHLSSIGVRSISSYLKKNGIETKILFLPLQKSFFSRQEFTFYSDKIINELVEIVKDCDFVGISLMSNYYNSVKDLTLKLKSRKLGIPIIWGGTHPIVSPEDSVADYICQTEGEKWMLKFCRNEIHDNSEVISNLIDLPFPDYDLHDNYVLNKNKIIPLSEKNFYKFIGGVYWTIYTRGCPFNCAYCCNNAFRRVDANLVKLRSKSPEYIVREIQAVKRFDFKYILFCDDTFFALSEEDIKSFCDHYKKHIGLPFIISGLNPNVFSAKKYEYMVKAGLIRSRMGIQSGSQRILKMYNRNQTNEQVEEISKQLQKHKIVLPAYDIILDNPWDTKQDKLDTINLLSKLDPPFTLNVFSLTFFKGTAIYEKAIEDKIDTKLKHYLRYEPTYLNLIITLFGIFKVPNWLIKFLLKTKLNFSFLHTIIFHLTLYRRGINSIRHKDFSMFPLFLQRIFCKIYKLESLKYEQNTMVNNSNSIEKETGDLYADCFQAFNYDQWVHQGRLLADQLGLNVDNTKDKVCLDAGCGHGSLVYQLHKLQARNIIGVDLKPCPPRNFFSDVPNTEFKQASLMNLPFFDNYFDIVVSSGVLHHTVNPKKGFQEMTRVLKPGGLLVLGVYGKHGLFPYCLSLARIFTVKIPIISKNFVEKIINWIKLDPIWRYQLLDYLYVPILKRYSVKQVINDFFRKNNIIDVHRVSNITNNKAQVYNENKTSYSYDHRKLKNRILFGYGFIVVAGKKNNYENR